MAARARAEHGAAAVGPLYAALGERIFEGAPDRAGPADPADRVTGAFAAAALTAAGLPATLADALDDATWDAEIRAETDEALSLTGRDVGTPIVQVDPPHGTASFGPVISRLPGPDEAVELWDHVVALARFPGFAELKRSLREQPQLPAFGVAADEAGVQEDWHAGSRRQQE